MWTLLKHSVLTAHGDLEIFNAIYCKCIGCFFLHAWGIQKHFCLGCASCIFQDRLARSESTLCTGQIIFSHKCPYRNPSIYILGKNISVFVFLTVVRAATLSTLAPTTDQQQPQATLKTAHQYECRFFFLKLAITLFLVQLKK